MLCWFVLGPSLTICFARRTAGLRVMDLSWNALTSITGLAQLQHLLFLDLSNNPKLPLVQVLPQV